MICQGIDSRPTVTWQQEVRELLRQPIRCESGTDSIVWMREDELSNMRKEAERLNPYDNNDLQPRIFDPGFFTLQEDSFLVKQSPGIPIKKERMTMSNETATARSNTRVNQTGNIRYLTVTGMLSAIAFVLMYFEFSVPFMPNFIALDISELPALIGSFAMGPACGVIVCLIKNLLHMTVSRTAFVGELSNFILGAVFVFTAGTIYKFKKTKKGALIGSFAGAIVMALFSIVSNYFIGYPF